jgi:hypothetical protein
MRIIEVDVNVIVKGDRVITPQGSGVVLNDQIWMYDCNNFSPVKVRVNTKYDRRIQYLENDACCLVEEKE